MVTTTFVCHKKKPDFLYRYASFEPSIDWTKRIFTNCEVYFVSPNEFNDPFDSVVRIIVEGSRAARKLFFRNLAKEHNPSLSSSKMTERVKYIMKNKETFAETIDLEFQSHRKKMGVFCLSEKRDNLLMWSHYSYHHQGFCLEFSITNEFFRDVLPVTNGTSLRRISWRNKNIERQASKPTRLL